MSPSFLLRAAFRRRLHSGFTPADPRAARESPSPVLFIGASDGAASLSRELNAAGFATLAVGTRALFSRARGGGSAVDSAVDALHAHITSMRCGAPPVAVAHGLCAALAVAYLESWPLGGLVALSPLSPTPRKTLARWLAAVDPLRAEDAGTMAALRTLLSSGDPEAAAEAAAFALALEPTRLEGGSVRMLALRSPDDAFSSDDDLREFSAHHALAPGDARTEGDARAAAKQWLLTHY